MKGLCSVLFLSTVLFCLVGAEVGLIPNAKSDCPGHPDHCFDKEVGEFYPQDGKFYDRPGKCQRAACQDGYLIEILGCGPKSADGCELTEVDLSKPFPDCCPQLKCNLQSVDE